MAAKNQLVMWKDLEESYAIKHGRFALFVEVPEPENDESRAATKNFVAKIQDLLDADKKKAID